MKRLLLAIALLGIACGIYCFVCAQRSETAKNTQLRPMRSLKIIGVDCYLYANDHAGRFPNNWAEVLSYSNQTTQRFQTSSLSEDKFFLPAQWPDNFQYVGGLSTASSPDSVLAYWMENRKTIEGTWVLFVDGHTSWLPTAEFKTALNKASRIQLAPNQMSPNQPTR